MFKNLTISAKITTLVVLMVFISLATISYVSYYRSSASVLDKYYASLSSINDNRAGQITAEIDKITSSIKFLQQSKTLTEGVVQSDDAGFQVGVPEDDYSE